MVHVCSSVGSHRIAPPQCPIVDLTSDFPHDTYEGRGSNKASVVDIDDDVDSAIEVDEIDPIPTKIPEFWMPEEDDEEESDTQDFVRELTGEELVGLRTRLGQDSVPTGQKRLRSVRSPTGVVVRPGLRVELVDGDFLLIRDILQDLVVGNITITGVLLRRLRRFEGYLPNLRNEVCVVLQLKDVNGACNPEINSSVVSYPIEDILQVRDIILTNHPFPAFSFRRPGRFYGSGKKGERYIEDTAELVCRFKYVEYCSLANGKVLSGAIMQLRESEADTFNSMSDVVKKFKYRGQQRLSSAATSAKGKENPNERETIINQPKERLDSTLSEIGHQYVRSTAQSQLTYSYGDICAGAGGMTRGAYEASLAVKFALDHWEPACTSWRRNFGHRKMIWTDVFEFCTNKHYAKDYIVDVLHISFPCQVWSGAKRGPGKNDEANEATGYAIMELLEKCKPRVVTFEQTSGLLERHPRSFRAMIHQIVAARYNTRWKIIRCDKLGNVHARKRLFIIASCPGEPLPPFPKDTHGSAEGLLRPVTIAHCLSKLPTSIEPHMRVFTPKQNAIAYDPNIPLRLIITCDGGESDLHPCGTRSFNMQELALLAGFPPHHKFAIYGRTEIRRQIGNAVPPVVAQKIFAEIIKSMQKEDRTVAAYKPEVLKLE